MVVRAHVCPVLCMRLDLRIRLGGDEEEEEDDDDNNDDDVDDDD